MYMSMWGIWNMSYPQDPTRCSRGRSHAQTLFSPSCCPTAEMNKRSPSNLRQRALATRDCFDTMMIMCRALSPPELPGSCCSLFPRWPWPSLALDFGPTGYGWPLLGPNGS